MTKHTAQRIVGKCLKELFSRRGLKHFWERGIYGVIDRETKNEIRRTLVKIVMDESGVVK